MSYTDTMPATGTRPASDTGTTTPPAYRRVLIPIQDAAQAEHAVELARRAGAGEARVLHLNLRESYGGRRFALETDSAASDVVEATVFELRMAGIKATGLVRPALIDRAADGIIAEAAEWGADLIVLGFPRRGKLTTRLFGSVTLRVLQNAPCPVLVASPASKADSQRVAEEHADSTR
ncbi:MAG TPA: universal stress protein [Streptosporangiaceae bacterium]|jgi:nucleotide-binding universal stress UspA family protein